MHLVIVTHQRPELLERTLNFLAECKIPPSRLNTIVVENGGQTGAEQVVNFAAPALNAKYLFVESHRKTVALNRALRDCDDDDLLVFLDDDVRVSPELLIAYHDAAQNYGRGHYFGGPTAVDYEVRPQHWLVRYLPPSAVGIDLDNSNTFFLGFNWAAFADDLRLCGGFSTEFGPGTLTGGGDESFMQYRMNQAGIFGRYVSDALVWHYVPAERCSPAWALARASGGGMNAGILHEHWRRTRGLPPQKLRSTLRKLRRETHKQDLLDLLMMRPVGRYWAKYSMTWVTGFWRGVKHGALIKPLDDANWRDSALKDFGLAGIKKTLGSDEHGYVSPREAVEKEFSNT
jgi:GT2 family glycosyltransferase